MRTASRYNQVIVPGHPFAVNGYVMEHVLVVEKALGRYLPRKHPIHHVDENKKNNAPGNLVICEDQAYHNLLHQRIRALKECGDANAARCRYCGKYDRQDNIARTTFGMQYHRSCAAAKTARRRQRLAGGAA